MFEVQVFFSIFRPYSIGEKTEIISRGYGVIIVLMY